MAPPKISIVVPIYNEQYNLPNCIESVLAQSFQDFELLLINDGSTDDSGLICERYSKDSRLKVYHIANCGVSRARNFGISKSLGDFIMFLDADDYLLPQALSLLYSIAIKDHVMISTANFYIESPCRSVFCTRLQNGIVKNNFRAWYFNSICLRAGAAIFHRSILNNTFYNPELSRYEDVECLFNLLRIHKVSYVNQCVMVYRVEGHGLSAKCRDKDKDYIFHMNFENKSFWEKMELACKLNEGLSLYQEYREELLIKYEKYLLYAKLDCKIRRFKKYKKKIYSLMTSKI